MSTQSKLTMSIVADSVLPTQGKPPRSSSFYEDVVKLHKGETRDSWKEFGGDRAAVFNADGSAYITRITDHTSKKNGFAFKLVERLTRQADGYGFIEWRVVISAVKRRLPPRHKFDPAWQSAILDQIREIAVNDIPVYQASRNLGDKLGINARSARAHLWAASKWIRGEATSFLPNRRMIRPIFELLCELGKKEEVLSALHGYCALVPKPSAFVTDVLTEYKLK